LSLNDRRRKRKSQRTLSSPTGPKDVFTIFATAITAVAAHKTHTHTQTHRQSHTRPTSSSSPVTRKPRKQRKITTRDPSINHHHPSRHPSFARPRSLSRAHHHRTIRLAHIPPALAFAKEHVRLSHGPRRTLRRTAPLTASSVRSMRASRAIDIWYRSIRHSIDSRVDDVRDHHGDRAHSAAATRGGRGRAAHARARRSTRAVGSQRW